MQNYGWNCIDSKITRCQCSLACQLLCKETGKRNLNNCYSLSLSFANALNILISIRIYREIFVESPRNTLICNESFYLWMNISTCHWPPEFDISIVAVQVILTWIYRFDVVLIGGTMRIHLHRLFFDMKNQQIRSVTFYINQTENIVIPQIVSLKYMKRPFAMLSILSWSAVSAHNYASHA